MANTTQDPTLTDVQTTRARIAFESPFWAALVLRLRLVLSDETPTAGTDGKRLLVNAAFWATLSSAEKRGVLVHETAHCMFGHPWRRGTRDPRAWNIAADIHANSVASSLPNTALPAGHVTPALLGLSDADALALPTEELYERVQSSGQGGQSTPCTLCDGGHGDADADGDADGADGASTSAADAQESIDDWRRATIAAAKHARGIGTLPGALSAWADSLAVVRLDWRAMLARWLTMRVPADYTWRRPSRRWASTGLYLPALDCEDGIEHLIVAVDSSGSVDDALLRTMLSEAIGAGRAVRAQRITFLLWDTRVYSVLDVTDGAPPASLTVSRGGTDVGCVTQWVEAQGETPSALVVLTDLETPFPTAPPYPVLWLAPTGAPRAPFGERIECW